MKFITKELLKNEIGRYINMIQVKELREFAIRSLDLYGDTNKLNQANQVIELLLAMLKKRKQIREDGSYDPWVEVMIVAGLLHNLLYDGTLTSVFAAREKLGVIADVCKVPANASYAIFQSIEAQLGDDMPIEACRPIPSTPNELFAWACWFIEELHGGKKMPMDKEVA